MRKEGHEHEYEQHETITWTVAEFVRRKRPEHWYWAIIAVGGLLFLGSLFLKNFLFAIFILIAVFIIFINNARAPQDITVTISPRGVRCGGKLYPFTNMLFFWVRERHDHATLVFRMHQHFSPEVVLPIADDVDSEEVRAYFINHHIPEEPFDEIILDRFAEWLGL